MIETSQDPNLPLYANLCWLITLTLGMLLAYHTLGKTWARKLKAQPQHQPKSTRTTQELQIS